VCETAATNRFVVLEMDSNQDVPLSSTSTSSAHASALGFSASTSTSARASSLGFSAFDESSLHLPDLPESDFGYYGGRGVSQIPPDAVAPPATFGPEDRQVGLPAYLSFAAISAQALYAAPSHRVCINSGY
jgi:hypothetical protein